MIANSFLPKAGSGRDLPWLQAMKTLFAEFITCQFRLLTDAPCFFSRCLRRNCQEAGSWPAVLVVEIMPAATCSLLLSAQLSCKVKVCYISCSIRKICLTVKCNLFAATFSYFQALVLLKCIYSKRIIINYTVVSAVVFMAHQSMFS